MKSWLNAKRDPRVLLTSAWFWGVIVFVVVSFLEILKIFWPGGLSRQVWFILDGIVFFLVFVLLFIAYKRLITIDHGYKDLEEKVFHLEEHEKQRYQQIASLIQANQLFAEADEEIEVFTTLLRLAMELVSAKGVSFVPLDERGQALAAVRYGSLPDQVTDTWLEYLASPTIRSQCNSCRKIEKLVNVCPVLQGSYIEASSIYCVILSRGNNDFGVLNLYLGENGVVAAETQSLLRAVIDEAIMSLESIRLRKKELLTFHQLRSVRQKNDLRLLYDQVLENIWESMDVDFAMLSIWNSLEPEFSDVISKGELSESLTPIVQGVLVSIRSSSEPIVRESSNHKTAQITRNHTVLAVPVGIPEQEVLGAILVTHHRSRTTVHRQLPIIKSMANQIALVIENVNRRSELEYRIMLEERSRLAREFHDGLAQTLGFLKLKMAQVINYHQSREREKIDQSLPLIYDTLSEAYLDARQAIDDLRLSSRDSNVLEIIRQMGLDFSEKTGLGIQLYLPDAAPDLPPEIYSQVLRIIQEALNNVRKHAHAGQVTLTMKIDKGSLMLVIQDDGDGFNLDDISEDIQHGLKGIKERAALIDAGLQIISSPGKGTKIILQLPVGEKQAV
jgi:two-component system nitrate/nitrite sensor histidine kinase NarX